MRPVGPTRDAAAVWDIATPSRSGRLPGVTMAGFRARTTDLVDLQAVPYPAVTLGIDLGDGLLVDDASGQPKRGSLAAGLVPGSVRARGRGIECLLVRLSPVVAHAALAASPEMGGTVVALDDLWGRDDARFQEQLRAAASWVDRFALVEAALARRHETGRAADPEVAFAWEQMMTNRPRLEKVPDLARDQRGHQQRVPPPAGGGGIPGGVLDVARGQQVPHSSPYSDLAWAT